MSRDVLVFLAGEGSNELGSRAGEPEYQTDERPGVLQALLRRVQPDGWSVGGARRWKPTPGRSLGPRLFSRERGAIAETRVAREDTRIVLIAALDALESGCDVLAFLRDKDGDEERDGAVEEGIRQVPTTFTNPPAVIGGAIVPVLEAWMLALRGTPRTERMSVTRAQTMLEATGVAAKDGDAMVAIVEGADLDRVPDDASSLRRWLSRARDVLPRKVAERAE